MIPGVTVHGYNTLTNNAEQSLITLKTSGFMSSACLHKLAIQFSLWNHTEDNWSYVH